MLPEHPSTIDATVLIQPEVNVQEKFVYDLLEMKVEIKQISPTNDKVKELFKLLDTHNMTYVPPEECHLTQPDELKRVE